LLLNSVAEARSRGLIFQPFQLRSCFIAIFFCPLQGFASLAQSIIIGFISRRRFFFFFGNGSSSCLTS